MVENRLNIQTENFQAILREEDYLRKLKNRYPIGSAAWNSVWDKLDRVLDRKRKYEAAVERSRMEKRKW